MIQEMVTQQLLDYIRQNLAAGLVRADIEKALLAAGWTAQDISGGFTMIEHPGAVVPPPRNTRPRAASFYSSCSRR